jgi:hypothetical protein
LYHLLAGAQASRKSLPRLFPPLGPPFIGGVEHATFDAVQFIHQTFDTLAQLVAIGERGVTRTAVK